jgi:hypothetical protein
VEAGTVCGSSAVSETRTGNWKPFEAGCVASYRPNQVENAPKLATFPVFLGVNSQRIRKNWQHLGCLVASHLLAPRFGWFASLTA